LVAHPAPYPDAILGRLPRLPFRAIPRDAAPMIFSGPQSRPALDRECRRASLLDRLARDAWPACSAPRMAMPGRPAIALQVDLGPLIST
jgi:hypothetical protein